MAGAENSKINAGRYFELLDPSAASFTFQTFADGKADQYLAAIFEGTLARNKRLKGSATLTSIEDAYEQGAGVWVTVNETDGTGRKIENIVRVRAAVRVRRCQGRQNAPGISGCAFYGRVELNACRYEQWSECLIRCLKRRDERNRLGCDGTRAAAGNKEGA
jgi:hypothetical protein